MTAIARIGGTTAQWAAVLVAATSALVAAGGRAPSVIVGTAPLPVLTLAVHPTPLAAPFLGIVAFVSGAVAVWADERGRTHGGWLTAAFTLTMVCVLAAASIASFILFWELMSLVSALLVATHCERRETRRAVFAYLATAQGGTFCLAAGLLIAAVHAGSPLFSEISARAATLDPVSRNWIIALLAIGFGSKAGLMPLHFWLPRAHPAAPPQASALLSGAMLGVALYGLTLSLLFLVRPVPTAWGILMIAVGAASAMGGAIYGAIDRDLKRVLAFSSVEYIGIATASIGLAVICNADGEATIAGLLVVAVFFLLIVHAGFKALLFLGAGDIARCTGTTDLERLPGTRNLSPDLRALIVIGAACAAGLPPTAGFVAEWFLIRAAVAGVATGDTALRIAASVVVFAVVVASAASVTVCTKIAGILGASNGERAAERLARGKPSAALLVLGGTVILFGFIPMLAVRPLVQVVRSSGLTIADLPSSLPSLAAVAASGAFLAGLLGATIGRLTRRRFVPVWRCGSPPSSGSRYTATAFSKPLRTMLAAILPTERRRIERAGSSAWFPRHIHYRTSNRYLIDDAVRAVTAAVLRLTRSVRIVQSGRLRLYLLYTIGAAIVVAVVAH